MPPKESITTMDVRNLNVPVLLVVSIVAFFVWATSFMMNERHRLHDELRREIRRMEDRIKEIDSDIRGLNGSLSRLHSGQTEIQSTIETKEAMILSLCEGLKKDNPAIKCGKNNVGSRN